MNPPVGKRCLVAYATRERQYLWSVDLEESATIGDALDKARQMAHLESVPWETAPVGIFGEIRARNDVPRDGDRIEIYRPLKNDPRQRRREHVQMQRKRPGG